MSFACINVPNFILQAFLRVENDLRGDPLAILDGHPPLLRVIALEKKAKQAGITLGMKQDQAELLGVTLRRRALDAERSAHQTLIDCALHFSPLVEKSLVLHHSTSDISGENQKSDWVVMDLRGMDRLYGSLENVAREINSLVGETGLHSNIGIAANPEAAILAARGFSGITLLLPGYEASQLKNLPVYLLDLLPEHRETFSLWGIRYLGELARLPDIALIERLGPEGARLQALARGGHSRPLLAIAPDLDLQESWELDSPIENIHPLLFVLFRLLKLLCTRMTGRKLAATEIALCLEADAATSRNVLEVNKSKDDLQHVVILDFPDPLNNPDTLLNLLHLNLVENPPSSPISKISLRAKTTPSLRLQGDFFAPSVPKPDRFQLTLARISAVVGHNRVGSPLLLATHKADAYRIKRFSPPTKIEPPSVTPVAKKMKSIHSALRRLRPPVPVQVETKKAVPNQITFREKQQEVLQAAGPWRSSGHWWDASCWHREEWDVSLRQKESKKKIVCRIYFDSQSTRWYMEGIYD